MTSTHPTNGNNRPQGQYVIKELLDEYIAAGKTLDELAFSPFAGRKIDDFSVNGKHITYEGEPGALSPPPGLLHDICWLMSRRLANYEETTASAVSSSLLGFVMSRAYTFDNLHPAVPVFMFGTAGVSKSAPGDEGVALLTKIGIGQDHIASGVASVQALPAAISRQGNMLLRVDEAGSLLNVSSTSGGAMDAALRSLICTLTEQRADSRWSDKANATDHRKQARGQNDYGTTAMIHGPALSLILSTTPEALAGSANRQDAEGFDELSKLWRTGFGSRFLVCRGRASNNIINTRRNEKTAQEREEERIVEERVLRFLSAVANKGWWRGRAGCRDVVDMSKVEIPPTDGYLFDIINMANPEVDAAETIRTIRDRFAPAVESEEVGADGNPTGRVHSTTPWAFVLGRDNPHPKLRRLQNVRLEIERDWAEAHPTINIPFYATAAGSPWGSASEAERTVARAGYAFYRQPAVEHGERRPREITLEAPQQQSRVAASLAADSCRRHSEEWAATVIRGCARRFISGHILDMHELSTVLIALVPHILLLRPGLVPKDPLEKVLPEGYVRELYAYQRGQALIANLTIVTIEDEAATLLSVLHREVCVTSAALEECGVVPGECSTETAGAAQRSAVTHVKSLATQFAMSRAYESYTGGEIGDITIKVCDVVAAFCWVSSGHQLILPMLNAQAHTTEEGARAAGIVMREDPNTIEGRLMRAFRENPYGLTRAEQYNAAAGRRLDDNRRPSPKSRAAVDRVVDRLAADGVVFYVSKPHLGNENCVVNGDMPAFASRYLEYGGRAVLADFVTVNGVV